MAFDYSLVSDMTENETGRICTLRPVSVILLLSCLSLVSQRWNWLSDAMPLTDAEFDDVENWVASASYDLMGGGNLIGAIIPFVASALPEGVLLCDGTTYDKVDYPLLWAALPAGMKTTDEFTVPDLTDKFLRGGIAANIGSTGGSDTHALSTNEIPSHNHGLYLTGDLDVESVGIPQPNAVQLSPAITLYTASTGGGAAHENRPAFYTVVFGVVAW